MADNNHKGTVDDPIPHVVLFKMDDDRIGSFGGSVGSTTVEVNDATDTVKGISKLSDSTNSTENAATGRTAATPLAVKFVNDKVDAETKKNLEQDKTLGDHEGRIDALETSGGSGGMNYVLTPKIIAPTNGSTGQNIRLTVTGSGYENVLTSDARKHRIFELSKSSAFADVVEKKEVNADSVKFDARLEAHTTYYVRIKDVSSRDFSSSWSTVVEFATGDATHANTPTLTLKGYNNSPTDIGSGLTVEASAYATSDGSVDIHRATSWTVRLATGRANVWESLNDATNKTSITIPAGTFQKSTQYILSVTYHSTDYNDSTPAEVTFTTSNDFGTVQAPVISISGEPDKILETPSFSGGVFSNTREPDTHANTEVQVLLSSDMSVVWSTTTNAATTSVTIPEKLLKVSTQYKVRMRYQGTKFGWSSWTEKSFTTAAEFIRYLYIGKPGTSTFGVGLAPKDVLDAFDNKLVALTNTSNVNHFQYGLYKTNESRSIGNPIYASAFLKCIPKFYIAFLQKDNVGTNLNDVELDALLPYVDVTKEQMKEAQRRSPYNAMVVAPASAFANRNEAQQRGFILPRGFIDGGKEKPCFFIANTLTTRSGVELSGYFDSIGCESIVPTSHTSGYNLIRTGGGSVNILWTQQFSLYKQLSTELNFTSTFVWGIISLLSLIQGQYATSTSDCAWYDPALKTNFPKGINSTNKDTNDSSVMITNGMSSSSGDTFVPEGVYAKTTHNGSVTGITHVNGWLWQPTIGVSGLGDGNYILKESVALKDVNSSNVENKSLYDKVSASIPNGTYWGATNKSPLSRASSGELWALNGAYCTDSSALGLSNNQSEFGGDYHHRNTGDAVAIVGGYWGYGGGAGAFCRGNASWGGASYYCGARLMAYPNV